MKNLYKLTAVLLCVALIISVTPIVSAQTATDNTIYTALDESIEQPEDEPYIVSELTEKRTENTKHFLMSDRSVVAAVYDEAVHYNDNGVWVDIDNSLSINGENDFENKSNSFKTKFSKKSNGNKLVTITKDNYSLSWMLDGANKVDAEISQSAESQSDDISALKNIQGTVTYPDIQNDVDLQYVVSGDNIKENIILQSAEAPTEYSFTYKFNKLKYRTNDNNQIELYDENNNENIIFVIDVPYMYDSDKAYSSDIEMQISETNKGLTITLVPDKDWLLSKDRVYPVVIDPTTLSSQKATNIWDIQISNTQTSDFSYVAEDFLVGSDTNGQVYRTLLKICELPDIGVGGIVVNAQMSIVSYITPDHNWAPALRPRPTDDIQVNIHQITANWPEQGVVWNDYADSYNHIVENYFIYNDTDERFYADITQVVSDWYSGKSENYGIMLKAANESAANHVMQFTSSDWVTDTSEYVTLRPVLLVNYRNSTGLEDYWSYSSKSLGKYGTGYVNLYNGNLVYVHDDMSFNSLINGFTLSHVFNSDLSCEGTGRYGNGWGLNLVQYFELDTKTDDNVECIYTDGDGTKHYFVELEDKSIVDEDGLGYTYSPLDGTEIVHQITDKDGNILKFDQWGALRRIIDSNGNTINLNYSPVDGQFNYLATITTSSGGAIYLNYDSEYKLSSIMDNAGRVTYFSYTNGNLTKITYPDNTELNFAYSGKNLCQITLPDGRKQFYYYYSDLKISAENFKSADNVMSDQLCFNYYHNQTEAIDLFARKMTYQFDTFGRATCIYDGNKNIYSQSYTATSAENEKTFTNNKISTKSNGAVYVNNLIIDPVFSNGLTNWATYSGGSSATRSVVTGHSLLSSKSILVTTNDYIHSTIYQTVNVSGSQKYTLSAYIKTVGVESSGLGAGLEIVTSNGRYIHSEFKTGTSDTAVDNGFEKYTVTVELQDGEYINNIGAGLFSAKGSAYIDSIQLEEGDTANNINIVSNSSFEKNSGNATAPAGFTTNFGTSTGNGASNAYKESGSYSCKIAGSPSNTRSVYQRINTAGKSGDIYSIGGWGKADSVATTYSNLNPKPNFRMYLNVYSGSEIVTAFEIKFNENVTDWQFASKTVIINVDYTMLEIFFSYDFNCNTAYFDNIFLYRDTMQSYTYDADGNVVTTADYAKQQSTFEYTDNYLTKVVNPNGTEYTYEYDDNKNLKKASSNIGVDYDYTYDSYGNATSATVSGEGISETINSSATYQNNGNHPHTVTDSLGNTTTYTYDAARGLQTGVTDANGNTTSYSYNSLNDRLDSVTSGNSTVRYGYDNYSILKSITSPSDTVYNFAYDDFGNTTETKVGTQALTSNTYNVKRGLLTQSVYGNGQKIGFNYDILDRITEKLYNDVVKVKFRYDKFGNLYEKQDLFTDITYRYSYDLSGRITGITGSDNTSLNYVYDEYNRTQKYIARVEDNTNSTEFVYGDSDIEGQKDGLIYGVKQNGTERMSYSYDGLARLSKKTINTTTPFEITYNYITDTTANTTTTLLRNMLIGDDYHNYRYDAAGNITRYSINGSNKKLYTYDSLNQLKTETRGDDVYEYTYDNGGNILSVTKNGEAIKTYGYTDSNWKDKLTSYNGTTITYDKIGNPLQYRDGFNFTWENGRQLTTVIDADNFQTTYRYNADGLRTYKNAYGLVVDYYWVDGVLVAQKTGPKYIVFLYDENGSPYGFVYNDIYYYYAKNAQGDIVSILDADGNVVVQYDYSAWGEILSITGSLASTIGQKNPLRYRGYYYDDETGFYYLQSRYYDPVTCRFINADGYVSTGQGVLGNNMFAYCGNNPVNRADPSGQIWRLVVGAVLVIGLVVSLAGCSAPADQPSASPVTEVTTTSSTTSSSTSDSTPLTNDQKVLIATIAAEATVTANDKYVSSAGRQAMANVALNRVGSREWSQYNTVAEICQYTGFDGYGNDDYLACMNYLNSRDGSNAVYEAIIWDVMAAYAYDITGGCQLYFTPAAMNPAGSIPNWNFDLLTEVTISGVDPYYEGRFFRY